AGEPIRNTVLPVRISVESDSLGGTLFWQELHTSVTTNATGFFSLVLGRGARQAGTAATFAEIDWSILPKFIRTEIDHGGWKVMGASRLWSVPYAMAAGDLTGTLKKLEVAGEAALNDEALFEVKNKNGQTVFAVYNEGVRVYVGDGENKAVKGGFAIGSMEESKAEPDNLFIVNRDSVRIYLYQDLLGKPVKGGFAIGSMEESKAPGHEYMRVTRDSIRMYISENTSGKPVKGGFAIGSMEESKGGRSFFDVNTSSEGIINPSENRILWYPLKNAFLTGKILIESPTNVGENSFSSGYESIAQGDYSQALGYKSIATGHYSTAIGNNAKAEGINSLALGDSAVAGQDNSYSFGKRAVASGDNSFSFGEMSRASGTDAYAIGNRAIASGRGAYAFGSEGYDEYGIYTGKTTEASGDYSIAIGLGANATYFGAVAIGLNVVASGYGATALGSSSKAMGTFSTAIGLGPQADGTSSMAIGNGTNSIGYNSFAGGQNSMTYGPESFAFGYESRTLADARHSVAFGYQSESHARYSFTAGYQSKAMSEGSVAIGNNSIASGTWSFAIGREAETQGGSNVAMGYKSRAIGLYSIAIGNEAVANRESLGRCFAFGDRTLSTGGNGSIALGVGTKATGSASVAIGPWSTASGQNSTSMGNGIEVSGNYSFGIALSNQYGTVISQANTMSIMGGSVGIGSVTPTAPLHVEGIDVGGGNVLFNGEYKATGPGDPPISGAGTRMMWYPDKAAFRAGHVQGTQWDKESIGANSVAMGLNTRATARLSTALGTHSTASGEYSMAFGTYATASGGVSLATGYNTTASGSYSTAMGYRAKATGNYSFAINLNSSTGPDIGNNMFRITGATAIGGNVAWTNYSDLRLKKDIQIIDSAESLNKLLQLNGVRFRWIDNDALPNLGLIAQEVINIVPESVRYDELNDIYSMEYTALIPLLIEGVKEQQQQIESQQLENRELRSELQALKEEVEALKAVMINGNR
ncbi:MAG: tail fiber domain-containing protein, partial [Bacteroidales bacterium]